MIYYFTSRPGDTPHLREIFKQAKEDTDLNVLCYHNADIDLPKGELSRVVGRVLDLFSGRWLLTGQRWDCEKGDEGQKLTLHGPAALDYFVFTRDMYEDMPDLLVGRPGWDNWMVLDAADKGIPTIDATECIKAIHHNHEKTEHRDEQHNMKILGEEVHIGRADFCSWYAKPGGIFHRPEVQRMAVVMREIARQETQGRIFQQQIMKQRLEVMRNPLVSVILPTYNRPDFLKRAVDSVLNQEYENLELLVINDGGKKPDGLPKDKRLRFIESDANYGPSAARNLGLRVARGRFISYLDDDDEWYQCHLAEMLEHSLSTGSMACYSISHQLEQHELVPGHRVTHKAWIAWNREFNPSEMLMGNWTPLICVMHEKECLDEVGVFDEDLRVLEDWDLWIRIGRKYGFTKVRKTTALRSKWGGGSPIDQGDKEMMDAAAEHIQRKYGHNR